MIWRGLLASPFFFLCALAHADLSQLPEPNALLGWQDTGAAQSAIDVQTYPSTAVQCPGKFLYPSHPQQTLKTYHKYISASYDPGKITGDDHLCLIHGLGRDTQGHLICVRADSANDVISSDVFIDACGQLYRGFVERVFLSQDETMGTLFSPGRVMYPDPHSEFRGSYVPGGTYPVPLDAFIKVGPLFTGDQEQVTALRKQAQTSFRYAPATHLFTALEN